MSEDVRRRESAANPQIGPLQRLGRSTQFDDEMYMRLALSLAMKGKPSPNPYVGAVIVKGGRVLASGFHRKAGMPHAEIEALRALKDADEAKGATMYVNLEPCNHFGRTPPCTDALVKAGIGKVVFAMKDPNPAVKGGGEGKLRAAGIKVKKGVLEKEARMLNEVFVKYSEQKTPFVVLKAAMSLDGKIATRSLDSKWITGEKAREYAHELRNKYDAVLVGINTVLKDNPLLTARIKDGKNPTRIILDNRLRIPLDAKVLTDSNVIMATSGKYDREKRKKIEAKGARVIVAGARKVALRRLLRKLGGIGITSILVEGGSEVHGAFVDQRLADKFVFFLAPKIIGGREAKGAIGGSGAAKVNSALGLRIARMWKIGDDTAFECYPK